VPAVRPAVLVALEIDRRLAAAVAAKAPPTSRMVSPWRVKRPLDALVRWALSGVRVSVTMLEVRNS
jgi:hypothetical protein